MEVFSYTQYRKLILDRLKATDSRWSQNRLSHAAGCSPSWLTRVLSGSVQLTPDQALAIAQAFGFTDNESEYFLLLVEHERAATAALKSRLQGKMKCLREAGRDFHASIETDTLLSDGDCLIYYSSWLFPTLHAACMMRPLTHDEISELVGISPRTAAKFLSELGEMGLVVRHADKWKSTSKKVHLDPKRPAAKIAHTLWRNLTVTHLQQGKENGLHYSAVHCISRKELENVREKLKEAILKCKKTMDDSPEETLAVLCLDLYELPLQDSAREVEQ